LTVKVDVRNDAGESLNSWGRLLGIERRKNEPEVVMSAGWIGGPTRGKWAARLLGGLGLLVLGFMYSCGTGGGFIQIYVTDSGNNRIVRMDDMTGTDWTTFGTAGGGANQFTNPVGLFVDTTGAIYVADAGNNRIVKMDDMTGAGWTTFGTAGGGANQFTNPVGLFVDTTGAIYVADAGNNRIVKMDDMTGAGWTTFGTGGSGVNQFNSPTGIVVIPPSVYTTANHTVVNPGYIYVTDAGNDRIVQTSIDMVGSTWTVFGTSGSGIDQFDAPASIVVNLANLYVADAGNNRIMQMVDMDPENGEPILTGLNWATFGTLGDGTNQFTSPQGVVLGGGRTVYIADTGNNRITRMDDMLGTNWTTFGALGSGTGQFHGPTSIVYRFQG
jgi:sugar lactone lactonase YvrE